MTAVIPTLVQEHNVPSTVKYGTSEKRLTKIYLEVTATNSSSTVELATYVPGLTGVLAIEGSSLDGADMSNSTVNTWSTTTLTMAGDGGSHVWKISLLAYY